jgi:Mce-associated membrane protein
MMGSLMSTEPDQLGATETDDLADETPATERGGRNPLVIAGAVLVAIAFVCAVVFGALWLTASHSDTAAFSAERDQALQAAEQGSINLTTLDYRDVAQGLARWKESTTGGLYSQLTSGSLVGTFTKQAQQAKSVTTGKVAEGVITELDTHAGKASALVIMNVTVSTKGAKPTQKLVPLQWDLTRTGSGWKLSGTRSNTTTPPSGQ